MICLIVLNCTPCFKVHQNDNWFAINELTYTWKVRTVQNRLKPLYLKVWMQWTIISPHLFKWKHSQNAFCNVVKGIYFKLSQFNLHLEYRYTENAITFKFKKSPLTNYLNIKSVLDLSTLLLLCHCTETVNTSACYPFISMTLLLIEVFFMTAELQWFYVSRISNYYINIVIDILFS